MTVVARKFISVPERTATATWKAISDLLAPDSGSHAAGELASISGIASSLITRESMTSPIIIYGSGPRIRIYCLYNDDATEGDDANESPLAFNATAGDWKMSLPCPEDDLSWVRTALSAKSSRISVRDMKTSVGDDGEATAISSMSAAEEVDVEAFFKS
jgi:hypothetical protein